MVSKLIASLILIIFIDLKIDFKNEKVPSREIPRFEKKLLVRKRGEFAFK